MRVCVRLFAILKDRAGVPELTLELSEGARAADAAESLATRLPALREPLRRCGYAVNREYCEPGRVLKDGDELALIPPVSGG